MKKGGLDLSLLDNVVDTLRQGKQLDAKYRDHELKCHQSLETFTALTEGVHNLFCLKLLF